MTGEIDLTGKFSLAKDKTGKPTFTETEIASLTEIIDDKALISDDDKKVLKKLKSGVSLNDGDLAELFSRCYNLFSLIVGSLKDDEGTDITKQAKEYLTWYDEEKNASRLVELVQCLKKAEGGFGTMHFEGYIRTKVAMFREDYLQFIDLFIKIVALED